MIMNTYSFIIQNTRTQNRRGYLSRGEIIDDVISEIDALMFARQSLRLKNQSRDLVNATSHWAITDRPSSR